MKKNIIILIVVFFFVTSAFGQDVKSMLEKKYESVYYYWECDKYKVEKNNKKGVCDGKGHVIIKPQYDDIFIFDDACHWYKVVKNGKEGYCNHKGKEIIKPIYGYCHFITEEGAFLVWEYDASIGEHDSYKYEYFGYVDTIGKIIIPPQKYKIISPSYKKDFLWVDNSYGKTGICNMKGNEIIPTQYVHIELYDSCFVCDFEYKGLEHDVYSLDGVKLLTLNYYTEVYRISEGLCRVKRGDGEYGYVNIRTGEEIIPCMYEGASDFKDGVAKVTKDGQTTLLVNPIKAVADNNQPKVKGKAVSTYPAPDSDVDKTIPNGKKADGNTHAFIMANENYPEAKVPYALNDGWAFEKYCKQTLGIKVENVHLFEDATGGNIMACVEQMKQVANSADGNATIIFYYAGHAFPDEEKSTAYLMPVDGDSKNPATGYSLKKLYKELNSVQTKQVICFLDACFSGATRDDQMLIAGRGVAIKVKDEIPQGNMVVMTSATGAETAHSYEEMHHGLFTYYLLHKLQEANGDVTLGELSEYVTKMVKRKSVLINQKKQTPTVIPSPQQQGTWQNIRL